MLARTRAVALTNYRDVARSVGLDPYAMLRRSGLDQGALNDPENWLPAGRVLALLEDSARESQRDDFSVLLGECRTFASIGPVSLLLKHELTLREVITAMIEYRFLLSELLYLRLLEDASTAFLEWSLIPGLRSSTAVNLLATVLYRGLVDVGNFHWQPDCVHFRHAAPRHLRTFERVFRCRLEFDSDFDGMSFHPSCLDLHSRCADPGLTVHARRLLSLLPSIRRGDSITDRTRNIIPSLLTEGAVTAERMAEYLGLSIRAYQRRLAAEGSSFSVLLYEARRELAVRYLSNSNQSLINIAQLIGFSTQSSFTRWFKSEFGMPPHKWRAAVLESEREEAAVVQLTEAPRPDLALVARPYV